MHNDELAEQVSELQRRVAALESRRVFEAERVDIVEADGTVRLVISNSAHAPDPVCDGQTLYEGRNSAGLIFYNDEGDECGGLVFGGRRANDGYSAGAALVFDQFKQDQVVGISHGDIDGRQRWAGLFVWDRPDEPFPTIGEATRVFVGKTPERAAVVELRDGAGHVRLRLSVTHDGTPRLEFLDASGEVTARLPD